MKYHDCRQAVGIPPLEPTEGLPVLGTQLVCRASSPPRVNSPPWGGLTLVTRADQYTAASETPGSAGLGL